MEKKSTFRIKEMRNGRHLTQEELGEIIGVSPQTFSRYEKQEALQTEVNDLQSKYDSEGIAGNLQQKYYYEVVTCLYQYEILFGIN